MRVNTGVSTLFIFVLIGCAHHVKREDILPESFRESSRSHIERLKVQSPFLKAHMKNGSLYVFDSWTTDDTKSIISGRATLYDFSRQRVGKGQYTLGLDSVALLETNVIKNSGAAIAMTVFTGITAAVTVFCIANPKACFGSCPTFYVSDGDSLRLMAEGFSSSISPSLEATDIDVLYRAKPSDGELIVEMKNEALETHVVRHVDLLAVPSDNSYHAFIDQDQQFWRTSAPLAPISATAPEGNCLPLLLHADGKERFSLADDSYLGTKEEIQLEFQFDQPAQSYGLLIGSRQTLLPTYLLYQALSYMGNDAGHWLAEIERKNLGGNQGTIERIFERILGGIEVLLLTADNK